MNISREKLLELCKNRLLYLKEHYHRILRRPNIHDNQDNLTELGDIATKESHFLSSVQQQQRVLELLPEIEKALLRIHLGTYGYCENTGEKIETKRLLAVPWTRVSMRSLATQQAS